MFYENEGDGTVPSRSLARALVWKPELLQKRYNFTYNMFEGATHIGILSNKNALSKIVEILEIMLSQLFSGDRSSHRSNGGMRKELTTNLPCIKTVY